MSLKVAQPRGEQQYAMVPMDALDIDLSHAAFKMYVLLRAGSFNEELYEETAEELHDAKLIEITTTSVRAILPTQKPRKKREKKKVLFGSWEKLKSMRLEDVKTKNDVEFFMSYHAMRSYIRGYGLGTESLFPSGNKFFQYKALWIDPMLAVFDVVAKRAGKDSTNPYDYLKHGHMDELRQLARKTFYLCKALGHAASSKRTTGGLTLPTLKSATWLLTEVAPVEVVAVEHHLYEQTSVNGTLAYRNKETGDVFTANDDEFFKIKDEISS